MKREEESKSPETSVSGDIVGILSMFLTEVEDEAEISPEFPIKEEKVEEIMQELYKEITCSSCTNVNPTSPPSTFASSSPSPPSSSSSSSQLSLSSMPFDVKNESCGASISEWGSTLMAGINFMGPPVNMTSGNIGLSENGSWMVGRIENKKNCGFGEKTDGCDQDHVLEVGDEWLARVLRCGPPLELEEWT
ncbi:SH3 and multiple ankyrin repeat domains protein like [Melia azedarach]|uniref:SH3 and multiple ankyrin repeat domains protein like n=1 Tax=Melia azedarach TaxID=155640 RepID=A0ACC1XAC7_MELAZ|nr:SH3 and multiple ankyrin repeat domains protein like [Melia azedarach]